MSEKEAHDWTKEMKAIKKDWAELMTQMEKRITSELKPFLDGIRTMDTSSSSFKLFRQDYAHFVEKFGFKTKIIAPIFRAWRAERKSWGLNHTAYLLFLYLGFVESWGNTMGDLLVMLLVANGKDFHIERLYTIPRIKHAVSMEDLEKERVPLTAKLNFLRDHGIEEFASIVDSKLRNAVAHLNFDIRKDEIYIKGKPARILMTLQMDKFTAAIVKISELLRELAQEKGLL